MTCYLKYAAPVFSVSGIISNIFGSVPLKNTVALVFLAMCKGRDLGQHFQDRVFIWFGRDIEIAARTRPQ
jgi:hypothetical protein